jgi:GTPase SAR1 family protein
MLSHISETAVADRWSHVYGWCACSGVDLKVKMLHFRGSKLKLTIWDTGEQDERRTNEQASEMRMHDGMPIGRVRSADTESAPHCVAVRRRRCLVVVAAGQERFRTLTSAYYRGAHGIILGQRTRTHAAS